MSTKFNNNPFDYNLYLDTYDRWIIQLNIGTNVFYKNINIFIKIATS